MNEGRGYDDTGAEEFGEEESPFRDADALSPGGKDREDRAEESTDQDNEDGRYPHTQASIITIVRFAGGDRSIVIVVPDDMAQQRAGNLRGHVYVM